ncbi:hypothetical protein KSX_74670 [Ktedonospora formicarum]|uniref:Uncharacterized protein n=1 Tax=Ktedonospora formicarum TaxID=2778364 RepID=A0A8J3I4I0_9CHLR|nr:hypothetical protein KSX_74670 [Ktedonospora formicarum]
MYFDEKTKTFSTRYYLVANLRGSAHGCLRTGQLEPGKWKWQHTHWWLEIYPNLS